MKKILLSFIYFFVCLFSIQAQTLYGLTPYGGNDGWGALIKFIPATNNLSVAHSFEGYTANPHYTNFIQASDGKLYGMTNFGGNHIASGWLGVGGGAIFSFDPSSSTYTRLKDFDGINGANPHGSLVQASNGKLYGMTLQGGSNDVGVIFSFDPSTSTYTKLKEFDFSNGARPHGSLIQASDGKLYGMTYIGGNNDYGVIFSFDLSTSIYTKLIDFDGTNGRNPAGSMMQASNGKLYGMTTNGGNGSFGGVIFSFDPSTSNYAKLHDFDYTNGASPYGSLMQASDGKLYGMTQIGGTGTNPFGGATGGVIFSFDPSNSTYTKLKDFNAASGYPYGSLVQASNGKLYGITSGMLLSGSPINNGVIFSFDPSSSTYTKLKDFDGVNGRTPFGSLLQASNGKLYAMTTMGGSSQYGVIFSFDPSNSIYTKLKDFEAINGRDPSASLVRASNGKLYGMTTWGGNGSSPFGGSPGIIFSFDPSSSTYTKLHDFDIANGGHPYGSLIQASDGKLYGMTAWGGSGNANYPFRGNGVIFSFDPSNSTYTNLHDFDGVNGGNPFGSLIQASDGKLYGMTYEGVGNIGLSQGTIFSFELSTSTFTKLKGFDIDDGSQPRGSLIQASNGKLYGMTPGGGSTSFGVIFSFDPSNSIYTKLYDFDGANGGAPAGSLMQASNGKLYGVTSQGGSNGYGVIFSFDPSTSIYTKLKDFDGTNGATPHGSLMQASDGKLYGMTSDGGSGGVNNFSGVIFSFDLSTSAYTKLQDFNVTNGAYPYFGSAFIELSNITSVAISITAGTNPTCPGQSVTFIATPVNGGSSPAYQWKVNGNNVGTNSSTYTTNTLTNGQVVTCVMTSGNTNPVTVNSNSITITINANVTPVASISITSGSNPSCAGQSVTFTAASTNGGSNPTYQWKVNGNNVGTNSSSYSTTTLTNGQIVSCTMTSSLACASPATAISNNITITVNSSVTPSANIAITAGTNSMCAGQSVTFTATPTNGGSAPTYQWKVNGNNVGTNGPTFTSNSLTNGQIVSCVMTSNLECVSPTSALSNNITMTINPIVVPSITIVQSSCNGSTVGFTSTINNGGSNPSYLWSFTGSGTATNFSGHDFTLTNAANSSVVQCTLTSDAACANPVQVSSPLLKVNCIAGIVTPDNLNLQIYPNPVRQNALITFYLGASSRISLDVFNIAGQQIAILEDRVLNNGNQTIPLNTEKLAAGIYFIRLKTVNYSIAKKVMVIR